MSNLIVKEMLSIISEDVDRDTIDDNADFKKLVELMDSMVDQPSLNRLTANELRSFKSFLITLHKCKGMSPDMALKHISAHWRGATHQAITKLPIHQKAKTAFNNLMA